MTSSSMFTQRYTISSLSPGRINTGACHHLDCRFTELVEICSGSVFRPGTKERARQTFMKSAIYAGFIDPATGRFVKPGISQREESAPQHEKNEQGGGDGDGTGDLELAPLLIALLKKIPSADKGWPAAQRVRWFRTFAMNVSQIYDGEGTPAEMKIELEKEAAN